MVSIKMQPSHICVTGVGCLEAPWLSFDVVVCYSAAMMLVMPFVSIAIIKVIPSEILFAATAPLTLYRVVTSPNDWPTDAAWAWIFDLLCAMLIVAAFESHPRNPNSVVRQTLWSVLTPVPFYNVFCRGPEAARSLIKEGKPIMRIVVFLALVEATAWLALYVSSPSVCFLDDFANTSTPVGMYATWLVAAEYVILVAFWKKTVCRVAWVVLSLVSFWNLTASLALYILFENL
ncbi:MAG: hypothetical protein KGL39_01100 [Patescibacteria group bacterium]|nr:hypothetical protein [Patescibacteria group bacterium]